MSMGVSSTWHNHRCSYTGDVTKDVPLVIDFLNTVDVETDTDVLRSAVEWHAWAAAHELTADPLDEAVRARTALRAAVGEPNEHAELERGVDIRLTASGPRLVATTAVGAVLVAATRLAVLDEWDRVKICPADDCRWAFYDRSRNRSRTWCSMRVCGNRQKARTFRQRAVDDE